MRLENSARRVWALTPQGTKVKAVDKSHVNRTLRALHRAKPNEIAEAISDLSTMGYIDLYCERIGPGLLAEPANTVTNAAFFLAAWALCRVARRLRSFSRDIRLLVALIIAIGFGSALFHTFAATWARVLDVVPILLFQLAFLWLYARQAIGWRLPAAAALVVVFLAAALYGRRFPHLFGGSLTYTPAVVVMLALGLYRPRGQKAAPLLLLAAAGVFAVSLLFRTIDGAVCRQFALGTHFLWHLLNPVVLYLCVRALIEVRRS